jgi:hypothetical protein
LLLAKHQKGKLNVTEKRDPAFCRERAAYMRMQAGNAEEGLKASYLTIAADWERLAEQAELPGEQAPAAHAS